MRASLDASSVAVGIAFEIGGVTPFSRACVDAMLTKNWSNVR